MRLAVLATFAALLGGALHLGCAATSSAPCRVWGPKGECVERDVPDAAISGGGVDLAPSAPPPPTTAPECQPGK